MFPCSLRPHGSLLFRAGLAALLPRARLRGHLSEVNGGGTLPEGAGGGRLAGPTPTSSPSRLWEVTGPWDFLKLPPPPPPRGGLGFSWPIGSHLLRGVSSPDGPCPKPAGDWGHLGERKWRQKVSRTQAFPGSREGQGVREAKARTLQVYPPRPRLGLWGSYPWKVNSLGLSLEGL